MPHDMDINQNRLSPAIACPAPREERFTMKVAIIGAGNVGKALATSITRAGHDVTLSAKNTENAVEAARDIGARAAESNRAAVADAELVILAMPFVGAADEVTDDIR